ncbi:MAG TPA: hypothetical protein VGK10_03985 [Prolixibacteraceae bacterium]|jgi:energy-coupling factor transporter ATP-binding protein EcfA2
MERITQITLTNYRAFYNEENKLDKYQIKLPLGENLLVYGENGSGKSSLYKAMEDFFLSAKEQLIIEHNLYTEGLPNLPETAIKINFSNKSAFEFTRLNSSALNNAFFNNTTAAFLTYKDILNTYFLDLHDKGHNPNLFNLFVTNFLTYLTDASGSQEIYEELESFRNHVKTFEKAHNKLIKGIVDRDRKEEIFNILKENLNTKKNELNNRLSALFIPVIEKVNNYLEKYFNFNFHVSLKNKDRYLSLRFSKKLPKLNESLIFNIKLYGKKLEGKAYQTFLNEARLSALAISTYFAALKIESDRLANQNLKFLFLDDIFIGLDTSNRIPLLEILNSDFKEFQIFLTTYDRNWFEVAKRWSTNSPLKFKSIELYSVENKLSAGSFEMPLIIDPSMNYFEKAKLYYQKKDYPAAANYLRKACENELKRILPLNLQLMEKKSTGAILAIEELGKLFEKFNEYGTKNNLDMTKFIQFNTYTKIIYNSLSHDDLIAPHYKKEIEDGITLVTEFQNIKSKLILEIGHSPMKIKLWSKGDLTKTLYNYEINLSENLYWIQQGNPDPKFTNSNCTIITPTVTQSNISINDAIELILIERGYNYPVDLNSICRNISISKKKLASVMSF